ncbi:MAG: class I SAM-dependent methyltransferase [Chloroflexota bacterium]
MTRPDPADIKHPRADWLALLPPGLPPTAALTVAVLPPDDPDRAAYTEALYASSDILRAVCFEAELKQAMQAAGIRPGMRVLDAACGAGGKSHLLLEAGADHVTGIDIDREALDLARRLPAHAAGQVVFQPADLLRPLPFDDATFDAVYVGDGFIGIHDPVALSELVRVLRPGGPLIFETVNVLPETLFAWDRGLQARVEAATWQALAETDYAADGQTYEAAFHHTRAALGLDLMHLPVTRTAPFDPVLAHYLLARFACQVAPLTWPHLDTADHAALLRLYNPTASHSLFQRADAAVTFHLSVLHGSPVLPPQR